MLGYVGICWDMHVCSVCVAKNKIATAARYSSRISYCAHYTAYDLCHKHQTSNSSVPLSLSLTLYKISGLNDNRIMVTLHTKKQ